MSWESFLRKVWTPICRFYASFSMLMFSWTTPAFLGWFYDDSFFYFKIAQNVAISGRFSFDGVNLTNGFHPLWLLSLVPPMYILKGCSPEIITRILFLCETGLLVITLIGLNRLCRSLFDNNPYASFLSLSLCLFLTGFDNFGQEAHLYGFLCIVLLLKLQSKHEFSFRDTLSIAGLVCLLFLSRLDSLIIFFPLLVYVSVFKTRPRPSVGQYLLLCLFFMVVMAIYFGINKSVFGHLKTISSHLKTSTNIVENINTYKFWFFFKSEKVLLSWVMALTGLWIYFRRLPGYLFVLCGGVIAYYLVLLLFSRLINSWYLVVPYILTSILCVYLIKDIYLFGVGYLRFLKRVNPYLIAGTTTIVLMVGIFIAPRLRSFPGRAEVYRIAQDMRRFDNNSLFYSVDGSGIMAFFSERRLINGDGLVNNYEYQNYLREGRLREYLSQQKVDYYIEYFFESPEQFHQAWRELMDSSGYAPSLASRGERFTFRLDQLVYKGNNALIFKLR